MSKEYIGDSVYVEIEDGIIKLTTENGYGPSNTIYLELFVYYALKLYVERVEEKNAWMLAPKQNNPKL